MSEQTKKDLLRGYLHPNTNKNKPSQPDHTGTCNIDGKEYRIAAWENKTADGKPYLSLTFSIPLTQEQKNEFKNNKEENSGNTTQNTDTSFTPDSFDKTEDVEKILRFIDNDDNPFETD